MKMISIVLTIFTIGLAVNAQNQNDFEKYFIDKTMRLDYLRIGNADTQFVALDHTYRYGIWAGSRNHLLDNFNLGQNYAKIYDIKSGELIFSKGFGSLFNEYAATENGQMGVLRAFRESLLIPSPKDSVRMVLEARNQENLLVPVFSCLLDPNATNVIQREPNDADVEVINSYYSGDPHGKVDVAILSEGYTIGEKDKFMADLQKFSDIMFSQEPYKSRKTSFNIYGVFKPSEDSGIDEPRAGIFRNTVLSTTFNTLGSERYVMTEDNRAMRDIAAHVPYDAIYIMVNHSRYGGGGIYNLYCTFTADNQFQQYLFLHEFGHSFSALADEYYTSSVSYGELYLHDTEPIEPNITARGSLEKLKWGDLVIEGTKIPTPWEKKDFDKMDLAWQKRRTELNDLIANLKKSHATAAAISEAEETYIREDRAHSDKVDAYLAGSAFAGQVGAFEGAGYISEGMFRPMLDCIMFTKGFKPFCKVCDRAIQAIIEHYLE